MLRIAVHRTLLFKDKTVKDKRPPPTPSPLPGDEFSFEIFPHDVTDNCGYVYCSSLDVTKDVGREDSYINLYISHITKMLLCIQQGN